MRCVTGPVNLPCPHSVLYGAGDELPIEKNKLGNVRIAWLFVRLSSLGLKIYGKYVLEIKCVFDLSLQLLFEIIFSPIIIYLFR
jgi:hypothetical protein